MHAAELGFITLAEICAETRAWRGGGSKMSTFSCKGIQTGGGRGGVIDQSIAC